MNFLENYYNIIIKYDLINKFHYKDIKQIPKLEKIVLYFNLKKTNTKNLISSLTLLELITSKKSKLIKSHKFNAILKLKKGNPIGCKIILQKKSMYFFLYKLLMQILPNNKHFEGISIKNLNHNTFSFKLKNIMIFEGLENQYKYFKELQNLQISIITNCTKIEELVFLLKSFKIRFK